MKATIILLAALGLALAATADDLPCVSFVHDPLTHKTFMYDLKALHHGPGISDSLYYRDAEGNYFYVNFCGATTSSCMDEQSVCQRAANYRYYGMGRTFTQYFNGTTDSLNGRGIDVVYSLGDACSNGVNRSTTIHVSCGSSMPGYFTAATENGCEYEMWLSSAAGCGILM